MKEKKILIVVTNTSEMDDSNKTKTGVWLEEFAVPFLEFKNLSDEGLKLDVTVASPLGGIAPIDEDSLECKNPTEWDYTKKYLDNSVKLSDVDYEKYDAIFIPGGHGPMFDLAKDELLGKIVSYFYNTHKIVSAVCHGPAGLINARTETGEPIVKGMQVTCFTNEEEKIVKKDKLMPFLESSLGKKTCKNRIKKAQNKLIKNSGYADTGVFYSVLNLNNRQKNCPRHPRATTNLLCMLYQNPLAAYLYQAR